MGNYKLVSMGAKFFKNGNRGKKFVKRFHNTRSWFRGLKWVSYHAHPNNVAGHPFKGGDMRSIGVLANPEIARFGIMTPILFVPPHPMKNPEYLPTSPVVPSFSDFFEAYFGGAALDMSKPRATPMLEGLKRCFETNQANAGDACAYYINGFKRAAL